MPDHDGMLNTNDNFSSNTNIACYTYTIEYATLYYFCNVTVDVMHYLKLKVEQYALYRTTKNVLRAVLVY